MITMRPSGRNAADHGRDFLGAAPGIGLVTGLDHDANHRFGARRTQDDAALAPQALRHLLYGALDLGNFHGGIIASAFLYDEIARS